MTIIVNKVQVLDHGYVSLLNLAGPIRRSEQMFDADDTDPANSARTSFDGFRENIGKEQYEKDIKLNNYLLKNRHTTPFEMIVMWFEMKMPIFVARQMVRHRTVSINEVSARYTQLPNEFYIPELKNIGIPSQDNKQGRVLCNWNSLVQADQKARYDFIEQLSFLCRAAYANYEENIKNGIPNEIARIMLPINIYTKWLWKQDLHNMMHFLSLRLHSHAQYEIQVYAQAIHKLLSLHLPEIMDTFDREILDR